MRSKSCPRCTQAFREFCSFHSRLLHLWAGWGASGSLVHTFALNISGLGGIATLVPLLRAAWPVFSCAWRTAVRVYLHADAFLVFLVFFDFVVFFTFKNEIFKSPKWYSLKDYFGPKHILHPEKTNRNSVNDNSNCDLLECCRTNTRGLWEAPFGGFGFYEFWESPSV